MRVAIAEDFRPCRGSRLMRNRRPDRYLRRESVSAPLDNCPIDVACAGGEPPPRARTFATLVEAPHVARGPQEQCRVPTRKCLPGREGPLLDGLLRQCFHKVAKEAAALRRGSRIPSR